MGVDDNTPPAPPTGRPPAVLQVLPSLATGGAAPTEMAILQSRVLYVINRNSGGIGVFAIRNDGTLLQVQNLEGVLPLTFADGLLVN